MMNIFTCLLALCSNFMPSLGYSSGKTTTLHFDELVTVKGIGDVPVPYFHLSFSSYNVFAPTDSAWDGRISENDRNCAVSAPNALIGSRGNVYDPNKAHGAYFEIANVTATIEDSLNPYFSLSKFKIKPLDGPPEPTTTLVTVIGYKYGSNQTVRWEAKFDQGYHIPLSVDLEKFGRDNWDNLSGVEILADYGVDALDWEFCLDDLELQFSHTLSEVPITPNQDQVVMNGENHEL